MAVCKKQEDGLALRLHTEEVRLFHYLSRQLSQLLRHGDPDAEALRNFYPSAQRERDPKVADTGLDEAMDAELMLFRSQRIDSVVSQLPPEEDLSEDGWYNFSLGDEAFETWLAFLTDLRLLLGAVLRLDPDSEAVIGEGDPASWSHETRMYVFLSGLQEMMLEQWVNPPPAGGG